MKLKRTLAIVIAVIFALSVLPLTAMAKSSKSVGNPEKVWAPYLNINGCMLIYSDDDYDNPWYTVHGEDRDYCESHNAGVANSANSFRSETLIHKEGDTLTFDYWYETESN